MASWKNCCSPFAYWGPFTAEVCILQMLKIKQGQKNATVGSIAASSQDQAQGHSNMAESGLIHGKKDKQ